MRALLAPLLLSLLFLALAALRALQAGGLWRDEAGAFAVATLPTWRDVYAQFPHEAFPLAFMAIVRGWVALCGGGDGSLRALGFLVCVGLIVALWWRAWRARTTPVVSLALVVATPSILVYGSSVRGYGLGCVWMVLAALAFERLLAFPTRGAWLAALGAALLAVHTVLPATALVAALGAAAAAVAALRRRWWHAVATLGAPIVALSSLLVYAPTLAAARSWNAVVRDRSLRAMDIVLAFVRTLAHPSTMAMLAGLAAMMTALVVGVRRAGREEDASAADRWRYRVLVPVLALAGQLVFLRVLGYAPEPWYFLPLLVLLGSSVDALLGTWCGERRHGAAALAVACVAVALATTPTAARIARVRMTNAPEVASGLAARATAGDLVLVEPWYYGISFARYYRGMARWETVPALADHRFHRYDLLLERMRERAPLAALLRDAGATLAGGHRVWVVGPLPDARTAAEPGDPGGSDVPFELRWARALGSALRGNASCRVVGAPSRLTSPYEAMPVWACAREGEALGFSSPE